MRFRALGARAGVSRPFLSGVLRTPSLGRFFPP